MRKLPTLKYSKKAFYSGQFLIKKVVKIKKSRFKVFLTII